MRVDAETLARLEISTWRTDAGDLDVLTDLPDAAGKRLVYGDFVPFPMSFPVPRTTRGTTRTLGM